MRLTQKYIETIVNSFLQTFKEGELYLFGSRVNDKEKGGDIDLYVVPKNKIDLTKKKIDFLVKMKRELGEQKIDVVIDRGKKRAIDFIAKNGGVLLCRN